MMKSSANVHRGKKLVQRLLFDVDTNMASNNPSIGPLFPDIVTADLTDEGVTVRATHPGH